MIKERLRCLNQPTVGRLGRIDLELPKRLWASGIREFAEDETLDL